jgi:hypothetical protein
LFASINPILRLWAGSAGASNWRIASKRLGDGGVVAFEFVLQFGKLGGQLPMG